MAKQNRKSLIYSSILAGGVFAALAPQAYAQQQTAAEADDRLEIVVTAERRATILQETPLSISVLRGEELDASTAEGINSILNTVPGVATTDSFQGGGTQVTIRGVSAAAPLFQGGSTVAYYFDGTPFGLVRSAVGPDTSPYDLARVEVLRGPQGTLFGAGGLSGVVRVLTNDPDLNAFEAKARATVSSTEDGGANYGGDIALNLPIIEGRLAVRGVVGGTHNSGWINALYGDDVNDADLRNYRFKVRAAPTDHMTVDLSYANVENEYGAPSTGNTDNFNNFLLPAPITTEYDSYGVRVRYETSAFDVTSHSALFNYGANSRTDLNPVGLVGGQGATQLSSEIFSQEFDLASNGDGPWLWNLGAFYRDAEDITYQPFFPPGGADLLANYADRSTSWAVFGQIGQELADGKFEWILGLRYFQDDAEQQNLSELSPPQGVSLTPVETSFDALTPRVVLQWHPDADMSVYASYSEGFRSGVFQDEGVRLVAPQFAPAGPDRLHNYEFGVKGFAFDRRVSYDAAVFYMDWDDVQQALSVQLQPAVFGSAIINGSSASGIGAELAVTAQILESLDVGLTLSWNDLTQDADVSSGGILLFEAGDRLNYSPEYTIGANMAYSFPLGDSGFEGTWNLSGNYTSEQTSTAIRGPARRVTVGNEMLIVNTGLSLLAPDERWGMTLFADNVLNEDGTPIRSPSSRSWDLRIRPRTVGLRLDYRL